VAGTFISASWIVVTVPESVARSGSSMTPAPRAPG
jgi:hypothetical protein